LVPAITVDVESALKQAIDGLFDHCACDPGRFLPDLAVRNIHAQGAVSTVDQAAL
jgi:hypothetical protein